MAAKIDKEFLLKHRFWILEGVFVVLVLVPLIVISTSVGSAVQEKQKDYDAKKKSVEDIRDPKNQRVVDAWQKQDNQVASKQNQVHRDAWLVQRDIYTWPEGLEGNFKDKHFGEPLPADVSQFVA